MRLGDHTATIATGERWRQFLPNELASHMTNHLLFH